MSYPDLRDKVVLITGGANGIGEAAARAFLAEGSKVVIVDISADALAKAAADIGAEDDRLITVRADVSREDDVKAYVQATLDAFGTSTSSSTTRGSRARSPRSSSRTSQPSTGCSPSTCAVRSSA